MLLLGKARSQSRNEKIREEVHAWALGRRSRPTRYYATHLIGTRVRVAKLNNLFQPFFSR